MLPGATGLDQGRTALQELQLLSEAGITRLLAVYGGRAADIAELCASDKKLAVTLDAARSVLAAEVAFAIRYEFARTLSDIVFRRLMVGLDADQGRPLYTVIAELAATELGWSVDVVARELRELNDFSDSLLVT
jgi:glycerol-3-phosphate dehydrogenase